MCWNDLKQVLSIDDGFGVCNRISMRARSLFEPILHFDSGLVAGDTIEGTQFGKEYDIKVFHFLFIFSISTANLFVV